MAIFSVNGEDYDSLGEATKALHDIWAEYKKPTVRAQLVKALSKQTPLDRKRAEAGVVIGAGGSATVGSNN